MLGSVFGRADEEVLDVVVGAPEAEVGVGGEEGLVGCLGELADCGGWGGVRIRTVSGEETDLGLRIDARRYRGLCTCTSHPNNSRHMATKQMSLHLDGHDKENENTDMVPRRSIGRRT